MKVIVKNYFKRYCDTSDWNQGIFVDFSSNFMHLLLSWINLLILKCPSHLVRFSISDKLSYIIHWIIVFLGNFVWFISSEMIIELIPNILFSSLATLWYGLRDNISWRNYFQKDHRLYLCLFIGLVGYPTNQRSLNQLD